ncbi:hypothetical protein Tco_1175927 [Tanacetum coccineum]
MVGFCSCASRSTLLQLGRDYWLVRLRHIKWDRRLSANSMWSQMIVKYATNSPLGNLTLGAKSKNRTSEDEFIHNEDAICLSNIKQAHGRFNTLAGNLSRRVLLILNLSDHRSIATCSIPDRQTLKTSWLSSSNVSRLPYSDFTHLSRSDEVLKLKISRKMGTLKLFQEWYEHLGPKVAIQKSQSFKDGNEDCAWLDDPQMLKITMSNTSSRNNAQSKEVI